MTWNDAIYGLGDFFWKTFEILPVLGNNFNWLIIATITVMSVWWIMQLVKFSKENSGNPSAE